MTAENPLLDFTDLPRFDLIAPEHVAPAVDALLAQARQALEKAVAPDLPPTWHKLATTLDVAIDRLGRAWGVVGHLNAVMDTPALRC